LPHSYGGESAIKRRSRRVVIIAAACAKNLNDKPGIKRKAMIAFVKTATPDAYADILGLSDLIRASNFNWMLARVPLLYDEPKTGKVKTGYPGRNGLGTRISRADLADFMLKEVKDTAHRRQAPIITH
jgi:NAD(P)H-binding